MPRNQKPGTARIDLEITAEAHSRFAVIHKALGFKTKTETFEALVFSISAKDVIASWNDWKPNSIKFGSHRIADVKNGQLFARKSTARGRLDFRYLDETSSRKVSLRERADMEQQIGRKLKQLTDYASKESFDEGSDSRFMCRCGP